MRTRVTITVSAICVSLALAAFALTTVEAAQAKRMPSVSEFIVTVPTAGGVAVEIGVVGFATGYDNGCVLVSEQGGLATLPGPCPRRR